MISKKNLDKRICDCEDNTDIKETYREFIRRREDEEDMCNEPIDSYSDLDLQEYWYEIN
jgi:hypothetical protein